MSSQFAEVYATLTPEPISQKKEEARIAEEHARLKYQKDHMYEDLHNEDNLAESSNQDRDPDFLDDFM